MNVETLLNPNKKLNSNRIRKLTEGDKQDIAERTSILDHFQPTITQRVKYLILKPEKIYCNCSKPLSFSNAARRVFMNTCGDPRCAAKSYDKEKAINNFKNTMKTRSKEPSRNYTTKELIEYANGYIKSGNIPTYFANQHLDICVFIRNDAQKRDMKLTQYLYHLIHYDGDMTKPEKRFMSYEKGYYESREYGGLTTKERNKIDQVMSLFDEIDHYEVINANPVNKGAWEIQCSTCDETFSRWLNNGRKPTHDMCPSCFPRNKSKMEYDLISEISKVYEGDIIHTYRLETTKNKNGYKSVDIYIPEFNLGIELNGIYFHQNEKNQHSLKRAVCEHEGIDLLQFTDHDYKHRKDIIISMINNKLGKNRKIHGRKCVLRSIDTETYRNFLESNHIKGFAAAKIKLGAYYNEELVSVFSVSKSRYNRNEEEIIRFCSVKNTTVVGILSKFLHHLKKNFETTVLVTYADLHYGNGNAYEKVGFEYLHTTPPNYFYYKHDKMYSRLKFQKNKLKHIIEDWSEDKTEKEMMESAGYMRYYDCGNKKFQLVL